MIYCPKCHKAVHSIICPYCSVDVFNYSQQRNKLNKVDIDTLRSDHRFMPELEQNQNEMLSILAMNEPIIPEDYSIYMVDADGVYSVLDQKNRKDRENNDKSI